MKIERLVPYALLIIVFTFFTIGLYNYNTKDKQQTATQNEQILISYSNISTGVAIAKSTRIIDQQIKIEPVSTTVTGEAIKVKKVPIVKKVYNNMTMEELTNKLNKSLTSTLSNTGHLFAKYSIKYGVDPYLAVAIALHETGCKWGCSNLVKQCNNVGGQKGSPGCGGGTYKSFSSLEAGIHGFIYNIYNNYYKYGLNTPELMNRKYAASKTWSTKVKAYMTSIKNS